jgi:organic radical activating enzyme
MDNKNLYLSEIFSAIQGEGPIVGVRQIFLRFSGCDIRCVWCDTPESLVKVKGCNCETKAGSRKFEVETNPISNLKLINLISKLQPEIHHSFSLTGGEPLLQNKAMLEIIPILKEKFLLPIYLETGGHRDDKLAKVIHLIDYVSMDFKLPTSARTVSFWDKHKRFLSIALKSKNVKKIWVKVVITSTTSMVELQKAVNLVKSFKSDIDIFMQPVSPINGIKPPDELSILSIQSKLLKVYPHIRVLPQVHRLMGQK